MQYWGWWTTVAEMNSWYYLLVHFAVYLQKKKKKKKTSHLLVFSSLLFQGNKLFLRNFERRKLLQMIAFGLGWALRSLHSFLIKGSAPSLCQACWVWGLWRWGSYPEPGLQDRSEADGHWPHGAVLECLLDQVVCLPEWPETISSKSPMWAVIEEGSQRSGWKKSTGLVQGCVWTMNRNWSPGQDWQGRLVQGAGLEQRGCWDQLV